MGLLSEGNRLWHVTVTVAGDQMEPLIVRQALSRLAAQRPFLHSLKFARERAEIRYWEEAECLLDAASLALRVWNEHRESAGLPRWEVVGLEVLERPVFLSRDTDYHVIAAMRDVTPLPF